MNQKDKRLAELFKWVSQNPERQNIPTIIEHAIKRYEVKEDTARNYAIQIMVKLGKLSQPIRVSDLYRKFQKASELNGNTQPEKPNSTRASPRTN